MVPDEFQACLQDVRAAANTLLERMPNQLGGEEAGWTIGDEIRWAQVLEDLEALGRRAGSDSGSRDLRKQCYRLFAYWWEIISVWCTRPMAFDERADSIMALVAGGADPTRAFESLGGGPSRTGRPPRSVISQLRIASYVYRRRTMDDPRAKAREVHLEIADALNLAGTDDSKERTIRGIASPLQNRVRAAHNTLSQGYKATPNDTSVADLHRIRHILMSNLDDIRSDHKD